MFLLVFLAMSRVAIVNPTSGSGDHVDLVRYAAENYGFDVELTAQPGDGVSLAAEAVRRGADTVLAVGGDGTVNEVVRGIHEADGCSDVTMGVVPTGTGNNFAANIGVMTIPHAFQLVDSGERRRIDLGEVHTNEMRRPFINSCVGGLTAEASEQTNSELKRDVGVLAYVITTLNMLSEFDGTRLVIDTDNGEEWQGSALCVIIGNSRQYPNIGMAQRHMEDGLLDVTVIEEQPLPSLAEDAAVQRLLGGNTDFIQNFSASSVSVDVIDDEHATFSLDGEMVQANELTATVLPRHVNMVVGERYRVPDEQ